MPNSKKAKKRKKAKKPKVWVCRGCCCGTQKEHPGVDHGRLRELAEKGADAAGMKFDVTECLGPCGQGNVVVVRVGSDIRWFRKMNDEDVTHALVNHLIDGGDLTALPADLDRKVMGKRDGKKPKS